MSSFFYSNFEIVKNFVYEYVIISQHGGFNMIKDKVIHGYKAFASDGTNIALEIMPPGDYHYEGNVKYGKSGFHFAKNLEDTIRYSGTNNPLIAEVIGSGIIDEGSDEYYGYYDVYAASDIKVVRYLTRAEILEYASQLNVHRMKRFIINFELTNEELDLFVKANETLEQVIQDYRLRQKVKIKEFTAKKEQ